jgi:hypothetical protein
MKRAMGVLGEGDKKAWAWASRAMVGVGMAVECEGIANKLVWGFSCTTCPSFRVRLHLSLNFRSHAEASQVYGKCILSSFWPNLHSRGFTVAHFQPILNSIFIIILLNFLPNSQKWAKNEIEN